jgi:hypothetical protein
MTSSTRAILARVLLQLLTIVSDRSVARYRGWTVVRPESGSVVIRASGVVTVVF